MLPKEIAEIIKKGVVIPALPLALNKNRKIDEHRQRALLRYYLDAGAGGVACAVHTTQFEIRNKEINLLHEVLRIAKEEFDAFEKNTEKKVVRIAGVLGKTQQAINETNLAKSLDFNVVLLGLKAFASDDNKTVIEHCKKIAEIMPVCGFYLQTAVGGRLLDVDFWREFAGIKNVVAIKIAPFNRYHTIDVVRGVAESGRAEEIALYTGNDDNIIVDLLTEYHFNHDGKSIKLRITGGLLGHWAVWTKKAVEQLERIKTLDYKANLSELLPLAAKVTDANAAFFDVANNFKGCIVGLHEVLRRQGLLENVLTLNPDEVLTEGQKKEIDRVYAAYPELNDDKFVAENLERWLK
ncbi:dihydrodipicolinate synthase family protein [Bacteroidota bacterium]